MLNSGFLRVCKGPLNNHSCKTIQVRVHVNHKYLLMLNFIDNFPLFSVK
jgi:hypothetical protein